MTSEKKHLYKAPSDGTRRVLRLLSRPVKKAREKPGIIIRAYRGFGSRNEVCIFGRVFRQPGIPRRLEALGALGDLANVWRRMWSRGVRRAVVEVRFGDLRKKSRTDRFGFFLIRFHLPGLPDPERVWYRATVELERSVGSGARATADVFIAPRTAEFVVVSDIDDTVVHTGVANKVKMLWRLFFTAAKSRTAFPGVGAFYRALHRGPSGDQRNPMLYVSRGPWSIYEVLDEFFHLNDIPEGPLLFLRYWGITLDHPLPRRAKDHKLGLIRQMLAIYKDLPFILIGDSGQKDPEIYARIVREHPGRILAIYIRNVSRVPERRRFIDQLARETARADSELVLADDSRIMAKHAARKGFIAAKGVAEVMSAISARESGEAYTAGFSSTAG
ncbi:MAG: phosphatase domain-containing protein [Desulfobacterales bacterium]